MNKLRIYLLIVVAISASLGGGTLPRYAHAQTTSLTTGPIAGLSKPTGIASSLQSGNQSENTACGLFAGRSTTTGTANSYFGYNAGASNTTGNRNSYFGENAGQSSVTGGNNSFFGAGAGKSTTGGGNSSFFGADAGMSNTTGAANSFFGFRAGAGNIAGNDNSFFGIAAGELSRGSGNSFFGREAGKSNTGNNNSFFGRNAGFNNGAGSGNSYFGVDAGRFNTGGSFNAFFGISVGSLTTGTFNAVFGAEAGRVNTSGGNNAFFGGRAGPRNTTGHGNSFFGQQAGRSNTVEDNNTFIGFFANGAAGITNATAIGANASVTQSNSVVLGDNASVGIGTSAPAAKLHVVGNVTISGNLTKGGGSFKIDHPLDPANKYLYHSFVESPDMKNIYDGVAVLNENGETVVTMPDWFEALNQDFRYQLTCIGGFAAVYVGEEIRKNTFKIAGGRPGMKVSWQVTGVRHDAYANAYRIRVEEDKPLNERGTYLHPDVHTARRPVGSQKQAASVRTENDN